MAVRSITCCALAVELAIAASVFNPSSYAPEDVIARDVAVIGGGASGTYGAIKLKDMGKSVIVIEKQPTFGGHTNTYHDPSTGRAVEYGVQGYLNTTVSVDFFNRFDIPLIPYAAPTTPPTYADFSTGKVLKNFSLSYNLSSYAAQLHKYPPFEQGWNLPSPVPEDLLMRFGDFVEKYSLQDIVYTIALESAGDGNILDELTLYVFFRFNDVLLQELSLGDGFTTANNSELYYKAQAELGADALVSSTVVSARRVTNHSSVSLVVQTPSGKKLIQASQLLISIPLTLDNMTPFTLDSRESDLFGQFNATSYYTALISNTGLPNGSEYENTGLSTPYHLPVLPGVYNVLPTSVPGIFNVWYGGPQPVNEGTVKAEIVAAIQRLSGNSAVPEFLAYASHTPFKQVVSADAIRDGFYDDLNGLQGYRNTWYTGNAFVEAGTPPLWNFTAQLLPKIAAVVDEVAGSQ